MDPAAHNKLVSFLWGIADDVLRDLFKRGKYPDVILPMCVVRRLDALLEPTKPAVLTAKRQLDAAGITEQRLALCGASGQAFYNASPFTLTGLRGGRTRQQLLADFTAYLDGFSPNVQDILDNFKFRNQLDTLSRADALGTLVEKFLDPEINLSPRPVVRADGTVLPGLDNHGMGTVFEELVRRFNEDNNEEAGEHWTPRDAVKLMADLVFRPVADRLKAGSYRLYDGALGTGGMLTVAEEVLQTLAAEKGVAVNCHLFGQEINPETYAVCKADLLLKGEGAKADHVRGGAEFSTLSNDAFAGRRFDFLLSNPPYGKSWKKDLDALGGKDGLTDPRFRVDHNGESLSLVTRSSDGQLLFLANMAHKMDPAAPLGSRAAEVHNGSSLFTGDAGQGESNVRRWVIENDWLEAVVALPLNLFYNTGIATYVWVLTTHKPAHRRGKVQLIDATKWFRPLRKNLGKKTCELGPDDTRRVGDTFLAFRETAESKIFPNAAFGYRKIVVERPLRLVSQLSATTSDGLRFASGDEAVRTDLYHRFGSKLSDDFEAVRDDVAAALLTWSADEPGEDGDEAEAKPLPEKRRKKLLDAKTWERDAKLAAAADTLFEALGGEPEPDHNVFRERVEATGDRLGLRLTAADLKAVYKVCTRRDPAAPPVVAKVHKKGKATADELRGRFPATAAGKPVVVEYEPDPDLRDTEQVPLAEDVEAFLRREVLPYTPDAWWDESATKIGYEISFTRHFYTPAPLRPLDAIRADIRELEKETEGLLGEIVGGAP